jgi:hypothetical protein
MADSTASQGVAAGSGGRSALIVYSVLAWGFVLCIAIQLFVAGMAVFADPAKWALHRNFVHFFELVPIAMGILALVARLPHRFRWWPFGFFFLIGMQYMTAHIAAQSATVAALHPVIAVLLFYGSMVIALSSVRRIKELAVQ